MKLTSVFSGTSSRVPVFRLTFLLLVMAEAMSFLGFLRPTYGVAAFFGVIFFVAVLALTRYELAVAVMLVELCVGSQGGYLFSLPAGGLQLSLRMAIFLVVVGVWAAKTVSGVLTKDPETREGGLAWWAAMKKWRLLNPYLALLAYFVLAGAVGLLRGNPFADVFFDGNGYAYLAALPAIIAGLLRDDGRKRIRTVLAAAVSWSLLKALVVFFTFSHRVMVLAPGMYTWVRDTRVGEITRMTGDFYRVFFQSHVFAVPALWFCFFLLLAAPKWRSCGARALLAPFLIAASAVIMGFSRSFWFGLALPGLMILIWFVRCRVPATVWKRVGLLAVSAVITPIILLAAVYFFPFPSKTGSVSFASLFGNRAFTLGNEAAAVSRWALLPKITDAALKHPFIGSGFGTTVTYKTSDPRLLADIPSGEYTTFAFEWGWHDLWLKLGFFGLAIYLWFLWALVRPAWRSLAKSRRIFSPDASPEENEKTAFAAAAVVVWISILAINVFSPYLNHPLGFGIFALLAVHAASFAAPVEDVKTLPGKA